MPRVKLIKPNIIQFDPETKHTWYCEGAVIDTPLTAFVCERLGKTLEIVGETKDPVIVKTEKEVIFESNDGVLTVKEVKLRDRETYSKPRDRKPSKKGKKK